LESAALNATQSLRKSLACPALLHLLQQPSPQRTDTSAKQKAIQDVMFGSDPTLPLEAEHRSEHAVADAVTSSFPPPASSSSSSAAAETSSHHATASLKNVSSPSFNRPAAASSSHDRLSKSKTEGSLSNEQIASPSLYNRSAHFNSAASPLSPIDTSITFTSPHLQVGVSPFV
jgi:hypothetical protein